MTARARQTTAKVLAMRSKVLLAHLTYDIEGTFDHQAYEKPAPEKELPNPIYFNKIIDSIDVEYSYQFLAEKPVTRVTEEVEISAVLASRDIWEYEVELVPRAEKRGEFTISFPLDKAPLITLADNISDELGIGRGLPDITLKATVHTVAQTEAGVVEDDFVQTSQIKLTGPTLEWDRALAVSEIGYAEELKLRYEHQGNFSYAIQLKPNILFGAITQEPEILPAGVPTPLESSETYSSETIDSIEGTFAYKFASSEELQEVIDEVEVNAVVGREGGWQETFVLVPKSQEAGDFEVTFSLDVPFFYAVIESIEEETDASDFSHELIVTADVHTTAQSEFGPVDETFSKSLRLVLEPDEVMWPEVTPEMKSGSIEEMLVVSNPTATMARVVSLGALGMTLVAFLYVIWSYWESKRKRVSRLEADAFQVRSRHQDLVVDVEKLPDIGGGETVIELGSLSELVKVADALLKPVLRLAEPERHVYCVIDGTSRYQYVSLSEELVAPPSPKPPPTDET